MKAIKDYFSKDDIRALAQRYITIAPDFNISEFDGSATKNLDKQEYRERVAQIGKSLFAMYSQEYMAFFSDTEKVLLSWTNEPRDIHKDFVVESISHVIEHYGLESSKESFRLMELLTQIFTAEWCIRPYVDIHFAEFERQAEEWIESDNEHLRRLVSEGTRPNLPWGKKVKLNKEKPLWPLPLLGRLFNDSSEYVRRSVANHMNDWSKDYPEAVVETIAEWQKEGLDKKMVRHALRNLIKRAYSPALELVGVIPLKGKIRSFVAQAAEIKLGETQIFEIDIVSGASETQNVELDFVVHLIKKNGSTTQKVFKGGKFKLGANQTIKQHYKIPFKRITTRVYYSGVHKVELQINGQILGEATFFLQV